MMESVIDLFDDRYMRVKTIGASPLTDYTLHKTPVTPLNVVP